MKLRFMFGYNVWSPTKLAIPPHGIKVKETVVWEQWLRKSVFLIAEKWKPNKTVVGFYSTRGIFRRSKTQVM